jgi:transmembrane sensor
MIAAQHDEAVRDHAARAFARMRSGEIGPDEQIEFKAWLDADEAHRDSFEDLSALWAGLDAIRADPAILSMREDAKRQVKWKLFERRAGVAAVAAMLLVALGVPAARWTADPAPVSYSTRVGQIASVSLADGTVAVLDTDSAIRFSEKGRRRMVDLVKGRVLFKVAKDPSRPFVVAARGRAVTALGTQFDVYLKKRDFEVTLFEGRVRVEETQPAPASGGAPAVELTPGYRLTASGAGWDVKPAGPEPGWAKGQLVFDEARLADIVEELNRYSRRQIVITDRIVGERRMSAVLHSGDDKTFLTAVEAMRIGHIRLRGERYELSAR